MHGRHAIFVTIVFCFDKMCYTLWNELKKETNIWLPISCINNDFFGKRCIPNL